MVYIDSLKELMIERTGGFEMEGTYKKLKGKKDKEITSKVMLEERHGYVIEKRIDEIRSLIINAYPNQKPTLEKYLALSLEDFEKSDESKSWAEYKFKGMPLAAGLPILSKVQSDARNSYAQFLEMKRE